MLKKLSPSINPQSLAFLSLVIFGCFILFQLRMFLDVFLGSIIFYVLGKPLVEFFNTKLNIKKSLAAVIVIFISFIIVLVPIYFLGTLFYNKLATFIDRETLEKTIDFINQNFKKLSGIELVTDDNIKKIQVEATGFATGFVSETLVVLGNLGIMYFILFYLLSNTGNIENLVSSFLPFNSDNLSLLGKELETQVYSNALGSPVLATLQGIVASIGFYFFDLPDPIFWGMIAGVFSIIPFIGSALIWAPAGLYLFMENNVWQGFAIVIYGVLIISTIDNIFRFVFQSKIADVHPLITILGVIFGLKFFGVSGLIFGPLTLSYFLILLKIYREKFNDAERV
ncbi:MAG: AI-2E family transporter [Bacteroidota bacterium]|jgi:predicted PurR-regulated permease PerM